MEQFFLQINADLRPGAQEGVQHFFLKMANIIDKGQSVAKIVFYDNFLENDTDHSNGLSCGKEDGLDIIFANDQNCVKLEWLFLPSITSPNNYANVQY